MLFCIYWKDMQIYFEYFGYAWLHTPKMIVSTCRRLWYLSSCQKYTSSFTSFLRYYILKNPVIWLAGSILAITRDLEFYQIWDWWWNINNNISFYFRLFTRKTSVKIFKNTQKAIFLGTFCALFAQMWAKMKFPRKKSSVSF